MTAVEFIEPLSREDGVSRATKLFVDMYATAPEGVWAAPGRVNLIGPCLLFSIWFGITTWNKEDDEKTNPTKESRK